MTLEPGDLIFTGTPGGVGAAMEPKRFLKPGLPGFVPHAWARLGEALRCAAAGKA
jgi:hypothetical protein